ncbi:unnamed protein product [Onchocerca flexuosa]|uniref:Uncharacterized protein n=1 Tax=Onchocerca flexuosa TaxID=387005 RepID=A0A183HYA0_9BILA|nr:unnamed protein product [Onchocerca flexuosa]
MTSSCSSPSSSGYGTLSKNNAVRNMQKQQNSVFGSSTMVLKPLCMKVISDADYCLMTGLSNALAIQSYSSGLFIRSSASTVFFLFALTLDFRTQDDVACEG